MVLYTAPSYVINFKIITSLFRYFIISSLQIDNARWKYVLDLSSFRNEPPLGLRNFLSIIHSWNASGDDNTDEMCHLVIRSLNIWNIFELLQYQFHFLCSQQYKYYIFTSLTKVKISEVHYRAIVLLHCCPSKRHLFCKINSCLQFSKNSFILLSNLQLLGPFFMKISLDNLISLSIIYKNSTRKAGKLYSAEWHIKFSRKNNLVSMVIP